MVEIKQDDVFQRVWNALPQIGDLVKEAWDVIQLPGQDKPTEDQKREICEMLMAGEHVLEALKLIPDLPDDVCRSAIEQMISQCFKEKKA